MNMITAEEALIVRLATELDDAVDRKDWPRLRGFFAETVMVEVGVVAGESAKPLAADAFVAEIAAFNLPEKLACHSFTNPLVTIAGARAEFAANRYGWNLCERFDPPLYELWGRIAYAYVRHDRRWLIDRFRLEKLRDAGNPAVSMLRAD
ncbi:SnoaL-like domain-containing protein [Sphingobium faniae]|nr:SnoaL-like domain-containing protein [Sphingobium faniae]